MVFVLILVVDCQLLKPLVLWLAVKGQEILSLGKEPMLWEQRHSWPRLVLWFVAFQQSAEQLASETATVTELGRLSSVHVVDVCALEAVAELDVCEGQCVAVTGV